MFFSLTLFYSNFSLLCFFLYFTELYCALVCFHFTVRYSAVLYSAVLYSSVLYCTLLDLLCSSLPLLYFIELYFIYSTVLGFAVLYCTELCCTLLCYFTFLYFTLLYFVQLCFTLLHFAQLYFTLLYSTSPAPELRPRIYPTWNSGLLGSMKGTSPMSFSWTLEGLLCIDTSERNLSVASLHPCPLFHAVSPSPGLVKLPCALQPTGMRWTFCFTGRSRPIGTSFSTGSMVPSP